MLIILVRNSGESIGCQMFEIRNFGWGLLEKKIILGKFVFIPTCMYNMIATVRPKT